MGALGDRTHVSARNQIVVASAGEGSCLMQAAYEALAEMVSTLDVSNVPLFLDCIGPSGGSECVRF